MSVVQTAKRRPIGLIGAMALMSVLIACSRNEANQGQAEEARPAPPASAPTVASQAAGEAPESLAESVPVPPPENPLQGASVRTAQAVTPAPLKADTTVADDAADSDDAAAPSAPALSAEQQELAAEVGDTRHASADAASSDQTPDQP